MILLLLALLVKSTYVRSRYFFAVLLYLYKKSTSPGKGMHFFHDLSFFCFRYNRFHRTSVFLNKQR